MRKVTKETIKKEEIYCDFCGQRCTLRGFDFSHAFICPICKKDVCGRCAKGVPAYFAHKLGFKLQIVSTGEYNSMICPKCEKDIAELELKIASYTYIKKIKKEVKNNG